MNNCINCAYCGPLDKMGFAKCLRKGMHITDPETYSGGSCFEFKNKEEKKMNIPEKIGMPAVLEQCAEECTELAQACLKIARKMRQENPTPATMDILMKDFNEEIADVMVCLNVIVDSGFISNEAIDSVMMTKQNRWEERLNKHLPEKEEPEKDANPLPEPCEICGGTGVVQIAPGVRGIKKCDACKGFGSRNLRDVGVKN